MPEYRLGRGYADYALLKDGKPLLMVEAKKLGTPLHDAASQGIGYCIEDGIAYFAVTNGRQWEIYETHKMAPIAEKLTVQFDIVHSSPITCLKAMALWRPAVARGNVMAAETPLIGLHKVTQGATEKPNAPPFLEPEPTPQEQPTFGQPPATIDHIGETSQERKPLTELNPQPKSKPASILSPEGDRKEISRWYEIVTESVRWLHEVGKLKHSHLPIESGPRQYIIALESTHPTGIEFRNGEKVEIFWVEKNFNRLNHIKNAQTIIRRVGLDPAQFKVRLR